MDGFMSNLMQQDPSRVDQTQQHAICSGKHPSPINKETVNIVEHVYRLLVFKSFHERPQNVELLNDGQTLVIRYEYEERLHPTVSSGPLDGEFAFEKIQFYFGNANNNSFGSEDRNNNGTFPMELHIFLRNMKYPTFREASERKNGIAVLAFFYEIVAEDNGNYAALIKMLKLIAKPDTRAKFKKPKWLWNFLHIDVLDYYTYKGSLLTQPCSEDVTWIEFHEPLSISAKQMEKFRHLYTHDNKSMIYSNKPVLKPLLNRTVFDAVLVVDPDAEDYDMHSAIPFVDNLVGGSNVLETGRVYIIVQLLLSSLLIGRISPNAWI